MKDFRLADFVGVKGVGKIIIVIGGKGTGKTVWVKSQAKQVPEKSRFIYDPNGEYKDLYKHKFVEHEYFIQIAQTLDNKLIVNDEASIDLSHKTIPKPVKDFCVRARHTGSCVVFVFHGIKFVPPSLYTLADYVVIFKTNDNEDAVWDRTGDSRFLEVFNRVKTAKWLVNSEGRKYSPFEVFDIYAMDDTADI